MSLQTKAKLDLLVGKLISRKFLVWLTATGLMAMSVLESGDWLILSSIFIGTQGVVDVVERLKFGYKEE
tara:strand:+ start:41777 stop:41983 length:207 start_codon:yes stop_codon:yes gene_type:complete